MSPTWCRLLLLLQLLLQGAPTSGTSPQTNIGKSFLVVFPESLSFYYPDPPKNQVQITSLHNNTDIKFIQSDYDTSNTVMMSGQTKNFTFDTRMELGREIVSNKTVQILSDKDITMFAISVKSNSIQTALVVPIDKLGTKYFIPPQFWIGNFTANDVTPEVTERNPFRILLLNAAEENQVTITGGNNTVYSLSPNQSIQVQMEEGLEAVEADKPVAVFFAHPCALREGCTCGQLYAMLQPARDETLRYLVPPVLARDAEDTTFVLEANGEDPGTAKAYDQDSPVFEGASTALLYRPGLLLTLIPESDFASCYVVTSFHKKTSYAVILVNKDEVDGVHVGTDLLEGMTWEPIKTTDYVAIRYKLPEEGKTVIWHSYSKMGVYFIGENGNTQFGHPATVISTSPDIRGCAVIPEVLEIGPTADGWRESLKYCEDQELELVWYSTTSHMEQINRQLAQMRSGDLEAVWIGMRRSSRTGQWYWANSAEVADTNWDEGKPGAVDEGQCAMMNVSEGAEFKWWDEDCCKSANPVCLSLAVFLPLEEV